MKKLKTAGWLILASLIILGLGVAVYELFLRKLFQVEAPQTIAASVDSEAQEALQRDIARCLIAQTLVVAYDKRRACHLSFFEAYTYAVLFYEWSKAYGVDWELYGSMMWIESQYIPTGRSKKDAKGLTQVLESTAAAEAESLGVYYKRNETVWNDVLNVCLGINYLSRVVAKHDTDIGINTYIGGPRHKKDHPTVKGYNNSVSNEYERLKILHRGIVAQYEDDPSKLPKIGDLIRGKRTTEEN